DSSCVARPSSRTISPIGLAGSFDQKMPPSSRSEYRYPARSPYFSVKSLPLFSFGCHGSSA
ncbi:MAG TPA: hypothetical protein PKZ08_16895, partial [Vicinamibacterales bacterium]|nr:hypothetical protein [Vicinamibacterales bacterium]